MTSASVLAACRDSPAIAHVIRHVLDFRHLVIMRQDYRVELLFSARNLPRQRLDRTAMRAANPAFIPRNHLVEEAISAAVNDGNFAPFGSLLMVLSMPYEDQRPGVRLLYVDPPRPDQVVHQTFCGT